MSISYKRVVKTVSFKCKSMFVKKIYQNNLPQK